MPRYRVYGLTLESSLVLPCARASRKTDPDVFIEAGDSRRFARARASIPSRSPEEWFRCRRFDDGTTYVQWTGLFEFLLSPDGRRIAYRRTRQATADSFAVHLLGQVLSFSLLARGIEALHATVVVVDGRAVAFLGDCGSGKSTLAAGLLARGFPLLTDDLMVLQPARGDWKVQPGIPRIKLFPSVARRVLGADRVGTPMISGTSKLVLPLDTPDALNAAVPLAAMYVLGPPTDGVRPSGRPHVESLSGTMALLEIVRAAFNLTVTDRDRLANQFAFATRVSSSVPLRRLTYARRLAALPGVCDAVLDDLAPAVRAPAMNT